MDRVGVLRERLHLRGAERHVDVQQAELEVDVQFVDGHHVGGQERHVHQLDGQIVGRIGGHVQQRIGERPLEQIAERRHLEVDVVDHVQRAQEIHLAPVHELLADLDVEGVEPEATRTPAGSGCRCRVPSARRGPPKNPRRRTAGAPPLPGTPTRSRPRRPHGAGSGRSAAPVRWCRTTPPPPRRSGRAARTRPPRPPGRTGPGAPPEPRPAAPRCVCRETSPPLTSASGSAG